jgi:hypothetical protein
MNTPLIDIERAKRNIQSITDNTQDALLGVLIAAYSDAVQKYCKRLFALQSYDELYNGDGDRRLLLRNYPIQSVQSVRYRPVTVLKVQNTDQATNQRASVTVTQNGLSLFRVASGVVVNVADTTLSYATYPTIQGLANAINALGASWSAQAVGISTGDYGLFPSADLWIPSSFADGTTTTNQGALTCRGSWAELKLHTYELQGYQWDAGRGWLLRAIPYTDPELLHPEDLIWPVGINNFRIQYTAGYTTIPEAVQEACAIWVAEAYYQTIRDPAVGAQSVSGIGSQSFQATLDGQPPVRVRKLLAPYRRHTVSTNQG